MLYKLMPFYCQSLSWLHLCCSGSCVLCQVGILVWCTSLVKQRFTVEQCLLWMTCTGHHWLIALWTMIGANYGSVTTSGTGSLYCDLGATPWR